MSSPRGSAGSRSRTWERWAGRAPPRPSIPPKSPSSASPARGRSRWCWRGASFPESCCRSRSRSTTASPTAPTAPASPPPSYGGSSAPSSSSSSGERDRRAPDRDVAMVMGDLVREVDVAVVGGGPGGYSAAFRCAELGLETLVVDAGRRLGGVCLWEGCIPSKALLHVGGGYSGLELGQVCAALGSKVMLVEMTDGLLPGVDRDLVQPLARQCERRFVKIWLDTKVTSLRETGSGIEARFGGDTVGFDRVLVAVGRRPASADLGLETTRVRPDARGVIAVDALCRTADPRIWAVGDVTGEPMLAHRAMRQGKVAAEAIAGRPAAFDNVVVPAVVFPDPAVAVCGAPPPAATAAGRPLRPSEL